MIGYVGLLKVELPAHTAYLTDGGFIVYDGDTYNSSDSVLGQIAAIEPMTEGKTGEIPALDITFNIPAATAITAFSSGALQGSTVSLFLAEYVRETGLINGTPDLQFLGQVDQPAVLIKRSEFAVSMSCVSKSEWFFERDIGNSLGSAFHKSVFPGETGHDNATGLSVQTAWGIEGVGGGGSYSGGGGRSGSPNTDSRNRQEY